MASILLPTRDWTASCETLYQQVDDGDELLVITDAGTDPAASVAADRDRAELVVAGEPDGCSGKCNAVAAGLERATHDVIVLTDDDVPRDPEWVERVKQGVDEHGAVFGAPLFVHAGGSGRLLGCLYEPAQALGSVLLLLSDGLWGGGSGFHRRHVDDMDALVTDLRRTVTDDLLIGEHLTTDPRGEFDIATPIPVDPSLDGFLDRAVRHILSFRYFQEGSQWINLLLGVLQLFALVFSPPLAAVSMIAGAVGIYWRFGVVRWTVVCAPVSLVVNALVTAYALSRPAFEWNGRQYRWRGKFDVEVGKPVNRD